MQLNNQCLAIFNYLCQEGAEEGGGSLGQQARISHDHQPW